MDGQKCGEFQTRLLGQKIGQNERLGVPSTKWLLLTPERFPHHTRPTFTRSTLLRGQVPHTARNKRSAVACHFLPAILALFGKNFTRKCTDFWGYRVDCVFVVYIMLDARNDTTQQSKLDEIQTAFSFPLGYFGLLYGLLLCWIGVYVASLTIGIRRFKYIRYEIIGLAIVTFTPMTAVCIFPVVQDNYCVFGLFVLAILVIILLLSVLMVTLSVGAVILQLCRSGLKCNSSVHVRALKEATPLLTFVVIHQIAVGFLLTYFIILLTGIPPVPLIVFYASVPSFFVSIPLFLLCQPRIRHGIRCKKKKRQQQQSVGVWNPSTGIQDVTSQTHYIVPPETSFTEEDALIIKQ